MNRFNVYTWATAYDQSYVYAKKIQHFNIHCSLVTAQHLTDKCLKTTDKHKTYGIHVSLRNARRKSHFVSWRCHDNIEIRSIHKKQTAVKFTALRKHTTSCDHGKSLYIQVKGHKIWNKTNMNKSIILQIKENNIAVQKSKREKV